MIPKMSETDLAVEISDTLKEWHWEVYQEVVVPGGIIDLVAVRGKIRWAIEVKLQFGLKVIEQAMDRKPYCHYSSVAVPRANNRIGEIFCRQNGIGVITKYGHMSGTPGEKVRPTLNRRPLKIELNDHQKDFCQAGGKNGGYWTPFKQTCRDLVDKVKRNEGIEFNKLIKELDHHYSSYGSAKSCLRGFIGNVIPELEARIVDRKLCIFTNGQEPIQDE